MKKNYAIFLAACSLMAGQLAAQCGLTVSASQSTVCAGDSVTLTATATGPASASSLTSTLSSNNNHRGNMFDIYATNTVIITSFDAHPAGNTTIEIYYRAGSYVGNISSSAGWTLAGSAAVTAQPFGNPTPVPVAVNVTIPAGQTYAFYVTSTNTSVSLNYTDGTSEGATYTSDANITFREGVGLEYPFTNSTGSWFTPRVWNGIIHYAVPTLATYSYLWSTTDTTATVMTAVNSTTQYNVQVDVTGCPTMYDSVSVQVSTPPVYGGPDVAVCPGTPVTLSATGAVSYSWNNSVTDTVPFTPQNTDLYVVTGTDSIGCTATDTVEVAVLHLPAVDAGHDQAVCPGTPVTLSGSGAVSYSWNNSVTDGVPFTPQNTDLYVVTGTDSAGCSATDTVEVAVLHLPAVDAGPDQTVCSGSPATLAGAGAITYSWSAGVTDGVPFVPAITMAYTVTGTDSAGCTNSDVVIVNVNTVNVATSVVNETITAAASGATYQWLDCGSNYAVIAGETSQSFTATANGSYAVSITQNGCTDTSSCTAISVGITSIDPAGFSLHPNPTSGPLTLNTGSLVAEEILVTDLTGKTIFRFRPTSTVVTLDLGGYADGVYFVRISTGESIRTEKVVKQ